MRCFNRPWHIPLLVGLATIGFARDSANSQNFSSISSGGGRLFVIGFTPVIGPNGGVGGVDVDADGVLKRVEVQPNAEFAELRAKAMHGVSADVRRNSPMRKVSLRRLEAEIARRVEDQKPLTTDMLFLAGLQRIQYVFVYPESSDIVIAGPAEGWVLKDQEMVGAASGQAVLRLDDLLDVLHGNAAGADGKNGISCSIDPTPEGMARVQQMFKSRNLRLNETVLEMIERQLGDQNVTVTGLRSSGHFARVMVGADYMMKRIAMDLERSPVPDLPSYMQLLQRGAGTTQVMAPRWWLATDYDLVQRSEDGFAWRLEGRGLKVLSEHGYLNARGELVNAGRPSPLAKRWADKFTSHYDELAERLLVFSQLRGCVDLAVVAALITRESLLECGDCPLSLLTDPSKLAGEEFSVPRIVPSQASAVRGRKGWVVSASGGVDLDTWKVLERVEINPKLSVIRDDAFEATQSWWWD